MVPPLHCGAGQDAAAEYRGQMAQMQQWYEEWQERLGAAGEKSNEDARFVLPGACETRIMLTMNARELRHFFALRMCSRAQWEIRYWRRHACPLYQRVPALFADAGPECLRRGCPEGAKSCGRQAEMRARREAFLRENQPSGLAEA
ncbi:MAG: FAD-dependent thymidylate synthase [Lachnospiraceae bacterium]